jgi:hypothetical protein
MTLYEFLSFSIALVAVIISVIAVSYNGIQVKQATKAALLQQQIERGNVTMHFTDRYFDLVKEGDTFKNFNNENWAYQFWSLHATEFYFFHHGVLPVFMYSLWMIDLANLYTGDGEKEIRVSHEKYLETYSFNYPEMIEFYTLINQIATQFNNENLRNKNIAEFVERWIGTNKKELLK